MPVLPTINKKQAATLRRTDWRYVLAFVVALLAGISFPAQAQSPGGSLVLETSGFLTDNGQVIAKLFRRQDDAPAGTAYRSQSASISAGRAQLIFKDLPYDNYALMIVHDENGNGTVDHNMFRFPSEPLGFSNNFKVSLFSGVPDFDDLKFTFKANSGPLKISVE